MIAEPILSLAVSVAAEHSTEGVRSFLGHPLVFQDKVLSVLALFSRECLSEQDSTWIGIFAEPGERWLCCYPDDAIAEYRMFGYEYPSD